MSYKIVNIEYHKKAMAEAAHRNATRFANQLDVEDCALSTWADTCTQEYHHKAIEALELGAKLGYDGPAGYVCKLVHVGSGRVLKAREIKTRYGYSWLLEPNEENYFGRKWVPTGKNSRIQKELGIKEDKVLVPIERYLKPYCAFRGGAMTFCIVPLERS